MGEAVINTHALRVGAVVFVSLSVVAQTTHSREHFEHATVEYDWVTNGRGEKLRTFVTRPNNASGKAPAIFFVGWLSCDTMESPNPAPDDGFGILLRRLIDESGYATVRMDKPGVGESQGDCAKADFQSEMTGWQAAFDSMSKYDFIDLDRVFRSGIEQWGWIFSFGCPWSLSAGICILQFVGPYLVRAHAGAGTPPAY